MITPNAGDLSPVRSWVLDRGYTYFREFLFSEGGVNSTSSDAPGLGRWHHGIMLA